MKYLSGWLKQLDRMYAGERVKCPNCGSNDTSCSFYVFDGGVGYADFVCNKCSENEHISRIRYPDNIKIKPIKL